MIRHHASCLLLTTLLWVGCSTTKNDIESARFHLDKAEYSLALEILTPLLEADPTNYEVVSLSAEAYFGRGFLGEAGSYLGVLSDFLAGQEAGKSNMESIEGATPAAASEGRSDIFAADDLLRTIPTASKTQENYLQAGFVNLATISVVGVATIGALATDDPCALDFDVLTSDDTNRFSQALNEVNGNFEGAGIDFASTELATQLTQMNSDLNMATDLATYLQNEFGAGACP